MLGRVVAEAGGRSLYETVERVRRIMVRFRGGGPAERETALRQADRILGRMSPARQAAFARAYTLYMELVNVCENAYRTHRLRRRFAEAGPADRGKPGADVLYVLTAHPTESRSPANIRVLRAIQGLLVEALERNRPPDADRLKHLLHLAWRVGTFPPHRPSVRDEAGHLFSLLDDAILDEILSLASDGHRVRLRTWVGGDKDGHPEVGSPETLASLRLSRQRLLEFVRSRILPEFREDVRLLPDPRLQRALARFVSAVEEMATVRRGDGRRVRRLKAAALAAGKTWRASCGVFSPALQKIQRLLELFPGLVVPLELREEAAGFGRGSAIAAMISTVKSVAAGGDPQDYARGVVVSMVRRAEDLGEAAACVASVFGRVAVPVIPLFELPEVLPRAPEILEAWRRDPFFRQNVACQSGRLEVMLGYSDTAKHMGGFASRLALRDAMASIGRWGKRRGIRILFFHGAGGSEGRGGGTVEEQAAAWPPGAMRPLKITVQGEMVERTFATPEILRSQVLKIAQIQARPPARRSPGRFSRRLAHLAERAYRCLVEKPEFQRLAAAATPYRRLGALRIGSRPPRRFGEGSGPSGASAAVAMDTLRAIPWVLCWTQVRLLLPVWFGLGSAWRELGRPVGLLRREMEHDPFLRGSMRLLGFTLAKAAPRLWEEYLRRLAPSAPPTLQRRIRREWKDALGLARAASANGKLLPDRPWLAESIRYRAPMIHPLNLLQIRVLGRKRFSRAQELLFRETVTGIAAGMLTTG